jgi:periplasmic copper chaperone A
MTKLISSVLLGLLSTAVQAHIVLDNQSAPAGSYYRGALKVGHGCNGSPVTQIIVTIPDGVQGAKPMPKPGWRIDIQRKTLAKPYVSHGRTVTEDVSEISWTAKTSDDYLPDAYYDEFVVSAKLPETPGKLYWKTSQICEQGRIDWDEIPGSDSKTKPKTPAAVLELTGSPNADGHHHTH